MSKNCTQASGCTQYIDAAYIGSNKATALLRQTLFLEH